MAARVSTNSSSDMIVIPPPANAVRSSSMPTTDAAASPSQRAQACRRGRNQAETANTRPSTT